VRDPRPNLNLAAALLSCVGGLAALVVAVLTRHPKDAVSRATMVSSVLGLVASAAWAAAAYQDVAEQRRDEVALAR
jgi:hypothetical protein